MAINTLSAIYWQNNKSQLRLIVKHTLPTHAAHLCPFLQLYNRLLTLQAQNIIIEV